MQAQTLGCMKHLLCYSFSRKLEKLIIKTVEEMDSCVNNQILAHDLIVGKGQAVPPLAATACKVKGIMKPRNIARLFMYYGVATVVTSVYSAFIANSCYLYQKNKKLIETFFGIPNQIALESGFLQR